MKFNQIIIKEWKQFQNVKIDFHPKLTIITGANGSGKTTILNILGKHFGWNFQELSTPAKDKRSGIIKFFTRFFKSPVDLEDSGIGKIVYDNNSTANLEVPISDSPNYHVDIRNQQPIKGLYIPSHRPVFNYMAVSQLPVKKRKKIDAYNLVSNSYKQNILGHGGGPPSNFHIKETLLTWAMYGYGNQVIEADSEQIEYYEGFEEVLKKILPKVLGFKRFAVRNVEIVLITDTGDFMLDAVSGGVSNLIDLAWQIYMYSTKESKEFVVLIDEVENHLHATMQRAILPDLLNAFPDLQFIVATHNPLIVGSVADSGVFVLSFNDNNKVDSRSLDLVNRAKTATQILREVLGVPFSMPIWVEDKLQEIISRHTRAEINEQVFKKMREELSEIGLEDLMPEAVSKFFEKIKNID